MPPDATNKNGTKKLIKSFRHPKRDSFIYTYFEPESLPVSRQVIEKFVNKCKKNKINCIIPCLPKNTKPSGSVFTAAADLYEQIINTASKEKIKIGFNIEKIYEISFFADDCPIPEKVREELRAKVLIMHEYYCEHRERLYREIDTKTLMAITALDEEYCDSVNLYDYIKDSFLDFTLPQGNRIIKEYHCMPENADPLYSAPSLNKLNFRCCKTFISTLFDLLGNRVNKHLGSEISLIHMSDICFDLPNRRNWDMEFNKKFESETGIDPKPLYDALFYNIGEKTPHIKALFMSVRAKMLKDGIIRALDEFAHQSHTELIYSLCEPKLPACSWITGDALANQSISACAVFDKAYMYGINSARLASSASVNYRLFRVCCELFGQYCKTSLDIIYKDAMNAFATGANLLLTHLPEIKALSDINSKDYEIFPRRNFRKEFCQFCARAQSLLAGGEQVSDIAVLYPIYSMHSNVFLYHSPEKNFEYPDFDSCSDYMTLMQTLSTYCAQNAILLHPETLNSSCKNESNKICLFTNEEKSAEFKIIFIPGTSVIDLENLIKIKQFYDCGGKVVATVCLPRYAAEYTENSENKDDDDFFGINDYLTKEDIEVRETVKYIFGNDASNPGLIRQKFYNRNKNGGEAYFIPASKTAVDGGFYTDEKSIKGVISSFGIPQDIYMSNLKAPLSHGFNESYPVFSTLGLNSRVPDGGVINHIHKSRNGTEIYYFSNTTANPYTGYIFMRGMLKPEFFNPIKNKRKHLPYRYVCYMNTIYTAVLTELEAGSSLFAVSPKSPPISEESCYLYPKIDSFDYNFLIR